MFSSFLNSAGVTAQGRYAGRVEELDLVFKHYDGALDVLVELDRRARSLSGLLESAMEMNECFNRLRITLADAQRG